MSYFSRRSTTYIDATVGWSFPTWQSLHDLFANYMPNWPSRNASTVTRIVGGDSGAVAFFTNKPGVFGASEIRAAGVVDIRNGKIERWVDYWDGRHFGISATDGLRLPQNQWPSDFGERSVGERAHPAMKRTVSTMVRALRTRDADALTGILADDVTFEDLTAHVVVAGRRSVVSYMTGRGGNSGTSGPGAVVPEDLTVRHVVGGAVGGGYEWVSAGGPVPRGVVAVETDGKGAVTRLTSMWDGSLVSASVLTSLGVRSIET
ncbi:hypothetical protein SAMN05216251_13053 [Actinacidiphila alni]|uniref:SnoaL-like domain-containing protein n=1 Tax=Actinacidiphila alni TaxID=380248 RepID=A0A1I2LQG3_9ACTN|nr:hypothetical protein [Actinacidiphila alni]SFF81564.1 hypothetical protein SAMN05216251_13053 [Actinacidiphila alni]